MYGPPCHNLFMKIVAGDGTVPAGTDEPAVPTGVGVEALWEISIPISPCFLSSSTQALADSMPPLSPTLVTPPPKQDKGKIV